MRFLNHSGDEFRIEIIWFTSIDFSSDSWEESDHRKFIVGTLNEWLEKQSSSMKISDEKLIENHDFKLTIICNDVAEEAFFLCSCGIRVHLTKLRNTFSLSNYYKHLKSKRCAMMKRKRAPDNHADGELAVTTDQESIDDQPSQHSISNQTQSSISSTTTTSYIDRLLKRSTISADVLSKKRRTER